MKKISYLLFFLTIASAGLFAQSMQLQTTSGQILTNGGTLGVMRSLFDTTTDIAVEIDMKNISTTAQSYKVKRTVKILGSPQKSNFCFAGGCFPDTTNYSPTALALNPGVLDNNFSSHISPNAITGSSLVYYKFYNIKDANDTIGIFVQTEVWHLGISDISNTQAEIGYAYPNPASLQFTVDYSITAQEPALLLLRNILGTTVREESVSGGNGKIHIDISDLPEGMYFYSLLINGKSISSRKLVIRH
jgi:hypothetical protein